MLVSRPPARWRPSEYNQRRMSSAPHRSPNAASGQNGEGLAHEVARRRTFAIISHPDAGKTTLTEKLLLFGGAIQMAGSVKGRKASRHATSDWMALEQQRGISVTSSVMQFPYRDRIVNLLSSLGGGMVTGDVAASLLFLGLGAPSGVITYTVLNLLLGGKELPDLYRLVRPQRP